MKERVSSKTNSLHDGLEPQESRVLENEKDGQKDKTVASSRGWLEMPTDSSGGQIGRSKELTEGAK